MQRPHESWREGRRGGRREGRREGGRGRDGGGGRRGGEEGREEEGRGGRVIYGGESWSRCMGNASLCYRPGLFRFLRRLDPTEPVLLSYMLADAQVLGYDYPCGGAGMVLSRAAYQRIARPLKSDHICPFVQFNDLSLALCLSTFHVPMVHVEGMHCMPTLNSAHRHWENVHDGLEQVAFHRLIATGNLEVGLLALMDNRAVHEARCEVGSVVEGAGAAGEQQQQQAGSQYVHHEYSLGRVVRHCAGRSGGRGSPGESAGAEKTPGPPTDVLERLLTQSPALSLSASAASPSVTRLLAEHDQDVVRVSLHDKSGSSILFLVFQDFTVHYMQARKFGAFEKLPTDGNFPPEWVLALTEEEGFGSDSPGTAEGGTTPASSGGERDGRERGMKNEDTSEEQEETAVPPHSVWEEDFTPEDRGSWGKNSFRHWKVELVPHRAFPPTERLSFRGFENGLKDGFEDRSIGADPPPEKVLRPRFRGERVLGLPDWVEILTHRAGAFFQERVGGITPGEDEISCGSDWMFVSFYGSATFVSPRRLTDLVRRVHELFPCGGTIPPLAISNVHADGHVEASAGVLLSKSAVDRLRPTRTF